MSFMPSSGRGPGSLKNQAKEDGRSNPAGLEARIVGRLDPGAVEAGWPACWLAGLD